MIIEILTYIIILFSLGGIFMSIRSFLDLYFFIKEEKIYFDFKDFWALSTIFICIISNLFMILWLLGFGR